MCKQRQNRKRRHKDIDSICVSPVNAEGQLCNRCKCDSFSCPSSRLKENRRWCTKHARILQNADFATQFSAGQFKDDDSKAWRVVLRTNYLHRDLNPDDDIAFQDVCTEFNNLGVGNPMIPSGVIALLFAHAITWPPAVRHFQERLRALSQGVPSLRTTSLMLTTGMWDGQMVFM